MKRDRGAMLRISGPSWRDPRLYFGLLLVLLAGFGSFITLTKSNRTETYVVASHALSTGSELQGALAEQQMNLGDSASDYLKPGDPRLSESKLRRPLPAGSPIHLDDLVPISEDLGRTYALVLDQPMPEGVRVGSDVEVWIAQKNKGVGKSGYLPASRKVSSAEVLKIEQPTGGLGSSGKTIVHLNLSQEDLPSVIDAVANESKVVISPRQGSE